MWMKADFFSKFSTVAYSIFRPRQLGASARWPLLSVFGTEFLPVATVPAAPVYYFSVGGFSLRSGRVVLWSWSWRGFAWVRDGRLGVVTFFSSPQFSAFAFAFWYYGLYRMGGGE